MKAEDMADKHAEEYRKTFRYYRAWHGQVVDKSPSTIVEQSFKDGFLAGFKACAKERLNVTTISDCLIKDEYTLPKDLLGLWEQTICEIRSEIKSWDLVGPHTEQYATSLCDKLEHSMCALAGGPYDLQYSIEEEIDK